MAAKPWNSKVKPKELVSASRPKRSTRTTEVNDTYTPERQRVHLVHALNMITIFRICLKYFQSDCSLLYQLRTH